MKKVALIIAFVSLLFVQPHFGQEMTANVHPGVELMTIIQIFAGKYPMPTKSSYAKEVENYFMPFKDHAAIKKIQAFEGNVYTDFAELGWCFSLPNFDITEPKESNWFKYYGKENVQEYLRLVAQFAKDSRFVDFYKNHERIYTQWGETIKTQIAKEGLQEKLKGFYRSNTKGGGFYICLDPLNSWGAHAIPHIAEINPQFADLKIYCIGYFNEKSTDLDEPKFFSTNFSIELIWHEGSHIYLNTLMKQYEKEIEALNYLYNKDDAGMKRQNINNWGYCMNENIVRGVVIALFRQYKTLREAKKQVAQEIMGDFIYAEDIANLISEKYIGNKKHKDFEVFFPEILKLLKKLYPKL
jgi:Domain of unknown function (DUF4932)